MSDDERKMVLVDPNSKEATALADAIFIGLVTEAPFDLVVGATVRLFSRLLQALLYSAKGAEQLDEVRFQLAGLLDQMKDIVSTYPNVPDKYKASMQTGPPPMPVRDTGRKIH